MSHIRSFTGLRGIASLFVILCHCCGNGFGMIKSVSESGNMAVYFFFVLSGYLLMKRGLAEIQPSKDLTPNGFCNLNLLYYCIRRIARVYPAYAVLLLFSKLAQVYLNFPTEQFNFRMFYFSHVENHTWTVKIKMIFYIFVLPVILIISAGLLILDHKYIKSSRFSLLVTFNILGTFLTVWFEYQNLYSSDSWSARHTFLIHFPAFWYGCLGGVASHYYHQIHKLNIETNTPIRKIIVEVLTYALLVKIYLRALCIAEDYTWNFIYWQNNILIFPCYALLLLVLDITDSHNSVGKAMSLPLFYFMGEISYSAYLVQFIIIFPYITHSNLRGLDGAIHVVLLTYFTAYILHKFIELKGVNYGNILIKKIKSYQSKYTKLGEELRQLKILGTISNSA